jgi:hypothetical protein
MSPAKDIPIEEPIGSSRFFGQLKGFFHEQSCYVAPFVRPGRAINPDSLAIGSQAPSNQVI